MDKSAKVIHDAAYDKIQEDIDRVEAAITQQKERIYEIQKIQITLKAEAQRLESKAKATRPRNSRDWLSRAWADYKQKNLYKKAVEYRQASLDCERNIDSLKNGIDKYKQDIYKLRGQQKDLSRQAKEWEKGDRGEREPGLSRAEMERLKENDAKIQERDTREFRLSPEQMARLEQNDRIIQERIARERGTEPDRNPEPPTREHNREEIRDTTRPGDNQREIDTSDNNPAPPTREDSERDPREDAWLRDIQNRADEAKTERSEPADTNSPAREDGEVSRENEPGEVVWRDDLKNKIDEARAESRSMEEFKERLEAQGIEVRERGEEIISFRHPDVKTNIRGATLGDEYSRENIERDLEQNRENPREDSREEPGREDRQQDQQQEPTREETRDTSIPSVRQWEEPTSTERDNPLPPGYQEPGINRLSESRTESRFEYTDTHPFEIMLQAKARERENPSPENRQEYLERREAWQTYHDNRLAEINGERDRDHDRSPDREDTEDRDHDADREDTEDRDNDRDMDRER